MNKKLFIWVVLASLVFAQEVEKDTTVEQPTQDAAELESKRRAELIKERENLQTLLKTLHYSCIVLARFQLSTYGQQLMDMLQQYSKTDEQNTIWKKVYAAHVLKCQKTITYDDSVKIFTEIKANQFDFAQYSYVFDGVTLDEFRNNQTVELTNEDLKTWKYIEDFEQSMKEKQKEQDDEDDLMVRAKKLQASLDLEPKIFGVEMKFGRMTQILALIVITSTITFIFWKLFRLVSGSGSKEEQKRKQKKKI